MNIVYATDNNYAVYTGISMASLMDNNKNMKDMCFYILDNGIEEENIKKLKLLCDRYHRDIVFVKVDDYTKHIDFQVDTHGFNPIVVVRLILTHYLPESVDKVLYIDGDTLVIDNLQELEDLDLEGYDVGAVPELYMPPFKKKESIGFEKNETYYNAGILLINLKRWRELDLQKTFLGYYKKHNNTLLYNDQDVINACCKGKIYTLPQWYNMSTNFCFFPRYFVKRIQPAYIFDPKTEYRQRTKHPVIIHYMGDERPWYAGSHNWCIPLFNKYAAKTPWKKVEKIGGKELYMFIYHMLNVFTIFCPFGRILFSNLIGINKYKWFGKE